MLICACVQTDNYNAETLDANWEYTVQIKETALSQHYKLNQKKKKNPLQVEPKSNNMCKHSTNSSRTSL